MSDWPPVRAMGDSRVLARIAQALEDGELPPAHVREELVERCHQLIDELRFLRLMRRVDNTIFEVRAAVREREARERREKAQAKLADVDRLIARNAQRDDAA